MVPVQDALAAVTVSGTLRYSLPAGAMPPPVTALPVRSTKVNIFRLGPEPVYTQVWQGSTDVNGFFSAQFTTPLPPSPATPSRYFVRVYARNQAVVVARETNLLPPFINAEFWADVGDPPTIRTATSDWVTLDFTSQFGDFPSRHFDYLGAFLPAYNFAINNRDPRETENIPAVNMQPYNGAISAMGFYDPTTNVIRLHTTSYYNHKIAWHEYAHFLQDTIGKFYSVPTGHDGCNTWQIPGQLVNSAPHAWMEGFGNWFSAVVDDSLGSAATPGTVPSGTPLDRPTMEVPPACAAVGTQALDGHAITAVEIEFFVAAALYDISDTPSLPGSNSEAWDRLNGQSRTVFQIFDHELDYGQTGAPTLIDFQYAWVARGHDGSRLERITSGVAIDFSTFVAGSTYAATQTTLPVVPLLNGGVAVVVRSTDNRLWINRQAGAGQAFGGWTQVPNCPLVAGTPYVLASVQNTVFGPRDLLRIFVRSYDLDDVLIGTIPTVGNTTWATLGGEVTSEPAVVRLANGSHQVFARSTWNSLVRNVQTSPNGPYGGWVDLGGVATSGPSAVVTNTGRVEVFVRGTDEKIWRCSNPGSSCNGLWAQVHPVSAFAATSAPFAVSRATNDAVTIAARDYDGHIRVSQQASGNGAMGAWTYLTTVSDAGSSVALVSNGGDSVSYFWRDHNTAINPANYSLWMMTTAFPGAMPSGPEDLFGVLTSAPVAVVNSAGRREVLVRGTDLGLWGRSENADGSWTPWTGLGGGVVGFTSSMAVGGEGTNIADGPESPDGLGGEVDAGPGLSPFEVRQ